MKRRMLMVWILVSCGGCQSIKDDAGKADHLLDASAHEQVQAIRNGQLSSVQLVQGYLERIEEFDRSGPKINSVLSINPSAIEEAKLKDQLAKQGKFLGPLHGLPVLIKDNIESSELPTTAGSILLATNITRRDAPIVRKLKKAGAIVLGKTNLSEWANFRSESSSSGWSGVGGLTRNPYNLSRTACGSSSGSGAAMAVRLASMAVGTETNGSITCPSAMNGVVGFKPTVGLLSRTHIVPISPSQDTAGPMVRSVKDAILMTEVMVTSDTQDAATASQPNIRFSKKARSLDGVRIGVARFDQGSNPAIISAFNNTLSLLEAKGAILVDITEFELYENFWSDSYQVLLSEFKTAVNHYLANSTADVPAKSLADLIAQNKKETRELVVFNQDIFEKSQATQGMEGDTYLNALKGVQVATREKGIDRLLKEHKVEFIVSPSNNPAFLIDLLYGDNSPGGFIGVGYLAAIAGYPHLSQPMTLVNELPVGFSIIGGKWRDADVLSLGLAVEDLLQIKLQPQFFENDSAYPALMPAMAH